jgi:hypothetical protein
VEGQGDVYLEFQLEVKRRKVVGSSRANVHKGDRYVAFVCSTHEAKGFVEKEGQSVSRLFTERNTTRVV